MLCGSWRIWCPLVLGIILACHNSTSSEVADKSKDGRWSTALEDFFSSIDRDKNGQIETTEALQYIDANFDAADIYQDASRAVQQMNNNLDSSDSDATISKHEVEVHLRKLLKGNRVAEWLKHSAQMPQYVQAFRDNSITSLDFPMLVADGGSLLESDLGVRSKLHREQLLRALKRVILGIGATPSIPQDLECRALSCDSVALKWRPPEKLGQPPMHKYKLERKKIMSPNVTVVAPVWETANGDLDDEDSTWLDTGLEVGSYQYRLTAWNVLGWSDYSFSGDCVTASVSLPCAPDKCWNEDTCNDAAGRQPVAGSRGRGMPAEANGGWKLISSSFGAIAIIGLLISARFMSNQQRRAVQELLQTPALRKLAQAVGISWLRQAPAKSPVAVEHPSPDAYNPPGTLSGPSSQRELAGDLGMTQRTRSSSGLPQSASRGSLQQLEHDDSGNSRGSLHNGTASRDSTPRRKSLLQTQRSDYFFPGDVEGIRGLSERHLSSSLPNLRVHTRKDNQLGASQEQEVVWLDDRGIEVNPPQALNIPQSPTPAGRHGCAYPGCDKSLHPLFNPRSAMTSHYCSICQSVFCQRHTSYSPHGKLGNCGMESKCICQICFEELPRITQERLEKSNKLMRPRKELAASDSLGSSIDRQRLEKAEKSKRIGLFGSGRHASSDIMLPDSPHGLPSPSRLGSGSGRESTSSKCMQRASQRTGSQHWARLRTAVKAVALFQKAGVERRSRTSEEHEGAGVSQARGK